MDKLDILIRRSEAERIFEFLRQYREDLSKSDYPPHHYRAEAIDDILAVLSSKMG